MAEPRHKTMSVEEFYLWQRDQDERYELVDGVPVPLRAMTGASNIHDMVVVNAIANLVPKLRGKDCRVATADTALRTAIRTTRRPDVTIDCAPPERGSYEARKPVVAIEVLSPSTRNIDRIRKLEEYKRHPSMRHILLVDPDRMSATLYSRGDGEAWTNADLDGAEAVIAFAAVGVTLPLGELYEGVPLDAEF